MDYALYKEQYHMLASVNRNEGRIIIDNHNNTREHHFIQCLQGQCIRIS